MSTDLLDVLIGHRFRILAEQLATAGERNRFRLRIGMFDVLHGRSCELGAEVVMRWSALATRRPETGARNTMSADVA